MNESKSGWAEAPGGYNGVDEMIPDPSQTETPLPPAFVTGDVVTLNSGGPLMTVTGRKAKGGLVTCEWFGLDENSGMELPLRWQGEAEMLTHEDDDYLEDEWWGDSPTAGPVAVDAPVKPLSGWWAALAFLVLMAAVVGVLAYGGQLP